MSDVRVLPTNNYIMGTDSATFARPFSFTPFTGSPFTFLSMDPDRKSTVSSFYGGRKSSIDALNADFIYPAPERGRDDASSFYNPDRTSMDHLNNPGRASAGYNRGSFFHTGREEPLKGGRDEEEELGHEGAWDVYADFNNAGPRYSSAFGTQNAEG